MAICNLDHHRVSLAAKYLHRVLLIGFVGGGLVITGCGGSSDASPASSESSSSTGSTDASMADPMMGSMGGSEMTDPAMQASMSTSMEQSLTHGEGETVVDTSIADATTSSDPATSDPAAREAAMAAQIAATETAADPSTAGTTSDPAAREAAMAAQLAAAGSAAQTTSDPAASEAEMATRIAAAGATTPASSAEPGTDPARAGFAAGASESTPGNLGEGGGAGQAQEPPADSPDYPAFKLVMGLMQGKYDGLDEFVSTKSRGLTEKIRSGSLTTTEKDDLKKTFAQPQLVGQPRTINGSRTVTLNSGDQVITLVSKKQGSDWKVSSITIRAAKKR
ncbi:MAG: hypothetical protein HQ518_21130 [Rhodopirellula sp.]|nr:hypothetical protein [Rhodopirellula sp.]